MGKGDKKTRKGKTYAGSYGNTRPHKIRKTAATKTVTTRPAVKKAVAPKKKSA